MKNINKNSSYEDRLMFAEIAKRKDYYETLGYKAVENFKIITSSKTTSYDLVVFNNSSRIFFEFKKNSNNVSKEEMIQRRDAALRKFPGSEFILVLVSDTQSRNENIFIKNLDINLFNTIKQEYIHKIKSHYKNFDSAESVEEVFCNSINIDDQKTQITGHALLRGKFSINMPDLSGYYVDTIPFKFKLQTTDFLKLLRSKSKSRQQIEINFVFYDYNSSI